MKGLQALSLLWLGLSTFALPAWAEADDETGCLTHKEAGDIISRWTSLAINISVAVADATCTKDIQFFSDSQDFLEGLPPGSLTGIPSIANLSDLISQQEAAQAPGTFVIPQYFTIFEYMFSCSAITFHWRFHAISSGTQPGSTNKPGDPVQYAGLDYLILQKGSKLIKTVYSEWNNGELLYDLGVRTCFQKNNASACS